MDAEQFLSQALGGNNYVATLTPLALREIMDAYTKHLQVENAKLKAEIASYKQCDSCQETMIPLIICERCQKLWES